LITGVYRRVYFEQSGLLQSVVEKTDLKKKDVEKVIAALLKLSKKDG
jgi:nucleoid DNA-binding protein